jgi:hypothetical protein
MSRSHRLAWAAGFMDGDGFITIQHRTSKVNSTYLRIGACQANISPLNELKTLFGGTIRIKNSGPNKENYKRKEQYIWTLSTTQAAEAIKQLLPFLIHKREVALLALEFQETMGTTNKISDETKLLRLLIKDKIQDINSFD